METTKTCTSCKILKPLSEFHKNTSAKSGSSSKCKPCVNNLAKVKAKAMAAGISLDRTYKWNKNNLPSTTVFSINPTTKLPYISYEHLNKLVHKHINRKANNLLMDKEDLAQTIMERLCKSPFNPAKAAATTFVIMVANSMCGNIYRKEQHSMLKIPNNNSEAKVPYEVQDFSFGSDEDAGMYTDSATDFLTPFEYLDANLTVRDHRAYNQMIGNEGRKAFPDGWIGFELSTAEKRVNKARNARQKARRLFLKKGNKHES